MHQKLDSISNHRIKRYAGSNSGKNIAIVLAGLPAEEYDRALMLARKEFITDICETTIAPLSEKDVAFLQAMSKDTKESAIQNICTRLNVNFSYVQRYKTRLSQAGIIIQKRRGFVEFAVSYLKEYLQEDGSS